MTIKDILDEMQDLNEKQLLEFGQPYIGIFYVIDDDVLFQGEHPRNIQSTEGVWKNYVGFGIEGTHFNFWYNVLSKLSETVKQLIKRFDKFKKLSWKALPRGRVICKWDNTNFIVFCDQHIVNNNDIKSKIKDSMNLPYNTEFKIDNHYICYDCDPDKFQLGEES